MIEKIFLYNTTKRKANNNFRNPLPVLRTEHARNNFNNGVRLLCLSVGLVQSSRPSYYLLRKRWGIPLYIVLVLPIREQFQLMFVSERGSKVWERRLHRVFKRPSCLIHALSALYLSRKQCRKRGKLKRSMDRSNSEFIPYSTCILFISMKSRTCRIWSVVDFN